MTPAPTPTAAEIERTLTRHARKRLCNISELRRRNVSWASALGDISRHTSRSSTNELIDKALIGVDDAQDCYLTPLGTAVRDRIMGGER